MIIFGIIFLACFAAIIWGLFIDDMVAESIPGKILCGFTLFPLGMILAVLVSALCGMFFSLPTLLMKTETIRTEPTPIYSLNDNASLSGRFVLGSGSVKSDLYYYYVIDTDSGKRVQKIKSDNGYIIEANETPNIVFESARLKSKFWGTVLIDLNGLSNDVAIMTLPENTIIQQYAIDLQ